MVYHLSPFVLVKWSGYNVNLTCYIKQQMGIILVERQKQGFLGHPILHHLLPQRYYWQIIILEQFYYYCTLIIIYFLWDLHYYFNLQDSKCCTKIDRTKQDVLDNLVRYRLFNASIFQQIETYLSTTTVMYKLEIFL